MIFMCAQHACCAMRKVSTCCLHFGVSNPFNKLSHKSASLMKRG